ncbi:hypothetical protein CALCODRAFT_498012 [Calocera cornea HHB12733]|uniref:Uncharacterized protein n=1 Tax=Calocera cornea HHB12733 TaxID=1353952 RepID=A0A165F0U4_9BASI|nr:hypothetical protein CALCODRAFT_498012 [Calocera cornea HHB12733]
MSMTSACMLAFFSFFVALLELVIWGCWSWEWDRRGFGGTEGTGGLAAGEAEEEEVGPPLDGLSQGGDREGGVGSTGQRGSAVSSEEGGRGGKRGSAADGAVEAGAG